MTPACPRPDHPISYPSLGFARAHQARSHVAQPARVGRLAEQRKRPLDRVRRVLPRPPVGTTAAGHDQHKRRRPRISCSRTCLAVFEGPRPGSRRPAWMSLAHLGSDVQLDPSRRCRIPSLSRDTSSDFARRAQLSLTPAPSPAAPGSSSPAASSPAPPSTPRTPPSSPAASPPPPARTPRPPGR